MRTKLAFRRGLLVLDFVFGSLIPALASSSSSLPIFPITFPLPLPLPVCFAFIPPFSLPGIFSLGRPFLPLFPRGAPSLSLSARELCGSLEIASSTSPSWASSSSSVFGGKGMEAASLKLSHSSYDVGIGRKRSGCGSDSRSELEMFVVVWAKSFCRIEISCGMQKCVPVRTACRPFGGETSCGPPPFCTCKLNEGLGKISSESGLTMMI